MLNIYLKKSFMAKKVLTRHAFSTGTKEIQEELNNYFTENHFIIPYEPKKINRWYITLPQELDIPSWSIKSASRPKICDYGFKPFWLRFNDPIGPSTTKKLWDLYLGITEHIGGDVVNPQILSELKSKFYSIKTEGLTFDLEMLDPTGVVIEKWTIEKAKIIEFDFGDLDYSNEDPIQCGILIKPGNIILHY